MQTYHELLRRVLREGKSRTDRTGTDLGSSCTTQTDQAITVAGENPESKYLRGILRSWRRRRVPAQRLL